MSQCQNENEWIKTEDGFEYNSGSNVEWLSVEELKEALKNI